MMTIRHDIWRAVAVTMTAIRPKGYTNVVPLKILAQWILKTDPYFASNALKKLAFNYRRLAVTQQKVDDIPEIPRCFQRWLRGNLCCALQYAQFARLGRSLPKPAPRAVRRAIAEWKTRVSEKGETYQKISDQIYTFAYDFANQHKEELGPIIWSPSAVASTPEVRSSEGGRLKEAMDDLRSYMDLSRPEGRSTETEGVRYTQYDEPLMSDEQLRQSLFGSDPIRPNPSMDEKLIDVSIDLMLGDQPQPKIAVVPDYGLKTRVLTMYKNRFLTPGDVIRSQVWPMIKNREWCDADKVPNREKFQRLLDSYPGFLGTWVSSDLTSATDYIPHLYCQALWTGILDALNAPGWCHTYVRKMFNTQRLDKGGYMRRGSPQGTPLSFITLSLLHRYAADTDHCLIRGDDFVGLVANPEAYFKRMRKVGFVVNRSKTFLSNTGGVFAERTFTFDVKTQKATILYDIPVKSLVNLDTRGRDGKRSKLVRIGEVISSLSLEFPPARRRTLYRIAAFGNRDIIQRARKAGVPVSLPPELGGAGIPWPSEFEKVNIPFNVRRIIGKVLRDDLSDSWIRFVRKVRGAASAADMSFIQHLKPDSRSVATYTPFNTATYAAFVRRTAFVNPRMVTPLPMMTFRKWARALHRFGRVGCRWAVKGDLANVVQKLLVICNRYVPIYPSLQSQQLTLGATR